MQGPLEPLLSFDTSSDMFLQFHCRETSLPSSSQLRLLFMYKELLRGSLEFVSSMEICSSKDLSTLLRSEPHSIANQESIRQSLIKSCLTFIQRGTTLESFEVEDLYGLSYWTLKKLFAFWPRFEVIPGVSDPILQFFMTAIPLDPPEIKDKHDLQLWKFVTRYMAQAHSEGDRQALFGKLVEQQRKLKPHLNGLKILNKNDYDSFAGGFENFCSVIDFKSDDEFAQCGRAYFCREECPNVKAEVECCEKTCKFQYNCQNRPTLSTIRPPFEVLRTTNGTNFGVYATNYFPPGVFVMEYIGVISHNKPAGNSSYVLECSKGASQILVY